MSSPYPILGNRPIDQWKVTELKEELKRRKLTTKGLKDDLIKRLDEAIRSDTESAMGNGEDSLDGVPHPEIESEDVTTVPISAETIEDNVDPGVDRNEKLDGDIQVDIKDDQRPLDTVNIVDKQLGDTDPAPVEGEQAVQAISVETSIMVRESIVSGITSGGQGLQIDEIPESGSLEPKLEDKDLKPKLEGKESKSLLKGEDSKTQSEDEVIKPQLEVNDAKPPTEKDLKPKQDEDSKPELEILKDNSSDANDQVSEVSPVLGFQVKSDSISTDSVSINEKNDLKDNVIAAADKLELDIKPDVVLPLSSNVVPDGGFRHIDVEEPPENKESVGKTVDQNAENIDLGNKNNSGDVGPSEQLNLDQSSGDDSMEEDVMVSKQIESKSSSNVVRDESDRTTTDVPVAKEEYSLRVTGDGLSADKKVNVEEKNGSASSSFKRKLLDPEGGNNETMKRQRRWNSESIKVPEAQNINVSSSTTPKDIFQPNTRRNMLRSDSMASDEAPKKREVPPSSKSPTNSLRIDRFLRPFTLKAVQELLGKTGTFTSFWMDQIKTHCYITYSSVEEAIETRNAVYNLQWPPNGGRLLVAEFVDPQDVEMHLEGPPPTPTTPAPTTPTAPPPTLPPQPSPRKQVQKPEVLPPPPLPPPPPLSNPLQVKERLTLPPPPPFPEKTEPPIVTLDDLFRKTKATPRIYYLPLSDQQVAGKMKAGQ